MAEDKGVPKFEDTEPIFEDTEDMDTEVSASPVDSISKMESFGKGMQQGATLGFADELQGTILAGLDKTQQMANALGITGPSPSQVSEQLDTQGFTGDVGPTSAGGMYSQELDVARKEFESAQQANPMSSLVGNIAGGALTMAAPIPGMGALSAPLGSAPKGAGIIQKTLTTGVNMSPMAAIGSAGMSEATNATDLGTDVLKGAGLGMGLGVAGQLAGSAIAGTGKAISKTQVAQDTLKNFKDAWQGLDVRSPEVLVQARNQLKELANTADQAIKKSNNKLFGKKTEILKNLEDSGVTVDASDVLKNFANQIGGTKAMRQEESEIIGRVLENEFKKGGQRSPMELENLLKEFQNLKGNVQTPSGYKAVSDAEAAIKAMQNNLDPQIQKINNKLFQTIEAGEALTGKNPMDYLTGKKELALENTLANKLENAGQYKVASDLEDIISKGLETGKGAKISPLNELVPEAAEAVTSAAPIAERLARGQRTQNIDIDPFARTIGQVTSLLPKAGAAVGDSAKKNVEFLQKGVQGLADATPQQLRNLSEKLNLSGKVGQAYAAVIDNAASKSQQSKNAIMFGLMQRPDFRALVNDEDRSVTEDGQ